VALTRNGRLAGLIAVPVGLLAAVLVAPNLAAAAPGAGTSGTGTAASSGAATTAEPSTPEQVRAKLKVLARASEQLSEQYDAAQIAVTKSQLAAQEASDAASSANAQLLVARSGLATSLAAQYKSSSFSKTAALLTSNSGQGYLDTMQSLGFISAHRAELATIAASATVTAAAAEKAASAATAAALKQRRTLVAQRTAMQSQVGKYTKLLATLNAAARAKYFAATAAAPAKVTTYLSTPVAAKSKGAAAAIAAARAELGKPYVYGAGGPGSFDCSGLTAFAYAAAGISLPHNAAAQYGYGTHVSQSQLQPGDLVFFYSPIGHVGIYIGNGLMIHAPTSGDVVKISPVFADGAYVGATRLS
jgi:peptidoglycan DL-endopeptidase CwlO